MRITNGMYYKNIDSNNSRLGKELFDVNKQMASGRNIQFAHEDPEIFSKTVRLDDEVAILTQVRNSAQMGYKFSTQTDSTIGEMITTLDAIRVNLIRAANDSNSDGNYYALGQELDGLKTHLVNLANTSVDGKFIFAGTKTGVKPISANGEYMGNDGEIKAFFGNDVQQPYNISGQDLFFGEESALAREISTNVQLLDGVTNAPITAESTIEELMGEGVLTPYYFYVRGTAHDGSSFKEKITLSGVDTVDDLLTGIKNAFSSAVDVSINNEGYIVIKDNVSGSSKLDFHLVGSSDDVADIDNLVSVKAFIKSGLNPAAAALADESALYDRTMFIQNGDNVTSNVSQILKDDNSFAVASTKLQDVFSDLSSTLHIGGNRIDGSAFNIDISFGSPAAVSGDYAYNIADGAGNDTDGADMTYGQLMDVINMAMNNITPADNNAGYQSAINNANLNSTVKLTSSGKIEFTDLNNEVTQSALTIYDNNSDDFSNTNGAMATFNTNNALSIRDPKMDFFNVIDQAIVAVKEGRHYPDGNATDPRNGGVENAIAMLDDLLDHVGRRQTESGAHSNSLVNVQERTDMLLVSTMTLRSEVLDVDIAQAYTRLEQLSLNQQALLSTVSRISQLSLVNYL